MKRRKVLTAAGAVAGATLAGCGGGGETGSEIGGEIAADVSSTSGYPVPYWLVPTNDHYQVEVVFGLPRKIEVHLLSNSIRKLIHSKPVTGASSHKVGFAKLRVVNEPGASCSLIRLDVTEFWTDASGAAQSYVHRAGQLAPTNGTRNERNIKHTYFPENDEYEWQFFSADPALAVGQKRMFCRVSFFRKPLEERYAFASPEYIRLIPNNAPLQNTQGAGVGSRQQHLLTDHDLGDNYHSRARKDPAGNTHRDTILIPDRRQVPGYFMLVPTLHHATPALRTVLEPFLHRHLRELGKRHGELFPPMNGVEDTNQSNFLSNELLRLVGGETLIEQMMYYRKEVFEKAESLFASAGQAIETFCENNFAYICTPELKAEANRLLLQAESAMDSGFDTSAARNVMNTVAIQIGGSSTVPDYPFLGCNFGMGFRLSFPLFRCGVAWARKNGARTRYPYKSHLIGRDNFSMQAVLIVKLFNFASLLSIDLEITFNLGFEGGNPHLQSVVIDPVLDADCRKILGRLSTEAVKNFGGLLLDKAFVEMLTYTVELAGVVDQMITPAAEALRRAAVTPVRENLAAEYAQGLYNALQETASAPLDPNVNTFELSACRFKFAHRDLAAGLTVNSPFWSLGESLHGWCPAAKSIAGIAKKGSNVAEGSNVYVRLVNVFDLGGVHGNAAFMAAQGLVYD
jgi:hypothetical protein